MKQQSINLHTKLRRTHEDENDIPGPSKTSSSETRAFAAANENGVKEIEESKEAKGSAQNPSSADKMLREKRRRELEEGAKREGDEALKAQIEVKRRKREENEKKNLLAGEAKKKIEVEQLLRALQRKELEDIFRKKGKIYDGSAEMVNYLFKEAIYVNDEETMKTLIFPGSPVLSAEIGAEKESFLQRIFRCYISPNVVIAQLLIDFGVNIDKQNEYDGCTALHFIIQLHFSSSQKEKINLIKLLLKNGANREIRNRKGLTPMQVCLFEGYLELAEEFLKEEDKLPNVIYVDITTRRRHLVKCLLRERNCLNVPSTNYSILLHFLILQEDQEAFEYVVNNTKFDVNAVYGEGTLLHKAVRAGAAQMIRKLTNVVEPVIRESLIHLACFGNKDFITRESKSRLATVKCLLRRNANVNALDSQGLTPLNYAFRDYTAIALTRHRHLYAPRNYILRIGKSTACNPLEPDLVTLIAFIAKMIAKKECVIGKNLILLEYEPARSIYQKCVNELSIMMKKNICESRNFCFFNILSEDIECLGRVLKDGDICQVLNNGEYKRNFPIYAEYLEDRILEASIRQSLVDLATVLFQKHVNKNIFVELLQLSIFKFLNLADFKNFARACFVDVE